MSKPYESWDEIEQGIDDTYSEKDFLAVIDRDRFNATLSELDATKAALERAREDLSHALHSLDETKQCCEERRAQTERAEKAEAACAALRESLMAAKVERDSLRERLGDAERVIEAAQKLLNAMNYVEGSRAHDLELAITTFDARKR